jgi:8-oxo-dGTP pyrophosphatase MutT (NUDIX family)
VVIAGNRVLLIRYAPEEGRKYFIPGGGVESGESPAETAVRELDEETGLSGTVERELAVVYNRGREEHYFLVHPRDQDPQAKPGDLKEGQTLEWVDTAALPGVPVWPKRLAWRIALWRESGWPSRPAVFADSSGDLDAPCNW